MHSEPQPAFLAGDSAMARMMRAHDWSRSEVGPPQGWPQSLRSVVNLMLGSGFPMFVAWGPQLEMLYNDAYAEILGRKHPASLGTAFRTVWYDILDDIMPFVNRALAGETFFMENLPLRMQRKGEDEDTWFTFSYSPVDRRAGPHGRLLLRLRGDHRDGHGRAAPPPAAGAAAGPVPAGPGLPRGRARARPRVRGR
jgi:hypothetical protein